MQLAAPRISTHRGPYSRDPRTPRSVAAACEIGPVLARPSTGEAACRSFAESGILPLVDDALDYGGTGAKLGKNVGDDFREGKITLPIILAFRRGTEDERRFWRKSLEKGEVTDRDLEEAVGLVARHNCLEDTIERARHYGAIAQDALALFPDGDGKRALLEAVEFCIARAH